jgi:ribosomal protein S18 acetylase RimI-like enzyme
MVELREAKLQDLDKIAHCHRSAFPNTLSSRLGLSISYKMLQWYLVNDKRFLFWLAKDNVCLGYAGGMISDGTQIHGSTSGTIQFAFREIVVALLRKPWLWFHPELAARYPLILKNIYFRITGFKTPVKDRKGAISAEPHTSLVVIGVHPEHQGKGYGSLLLKVFEQKTIDMGFNKMLLTVLAENAQAIKSYTKNGWTKVRQEGKSVNMQKIVHK